MFSLSGTVQSSSDAVGQTEVLCCSLMFNCSYNCSISCHYLLLSVHLLYVEQKNRWTLVDNISLGHFTSHASYSIINRGLHCYNALMQGTQRISYIGLYA